MLIINADDYGLCPEVDEGIMRLVEMGRVTSVSLLANHSTPESAARLAGSTPRPSIGIHASFTLGPFCGDASETADFLDGDGRPYKPSTRFIEHARADAVELELRRQLDKALSWGLELTHLDSHHHAHRRPDLMELFARVAIEHDLALRTIDDETRETARGLGARTSDRFIMEFYGEGATPENLERLLNDIPGGVTEIMTHPAIEGPGLASVTGYVEGRYREYETLASSGFGTLIETLGIELAGWRDVSR